MRIGLTDQEEVRPLRQHLFTKGLVAGKVIASEGDVCAITLAILGQPTLRRRALTVLFLMTVLGTNELGSQRNHLGFIGCHEDWRDGPMEIGGDPILVGSMRAGVTVNGLRGKVFGAV